MYVDCTKNMIENPSEMAIRVSDRHFGVGSDGMILIKSSEKGGFFHGNVQCRRFPGQDVRQWNKMRRKICV